MYRLTASAEVAYCIGSQLLQKWHNVHAVDSDMRCQDISACLMISASKDAIAQSQVLEILHDSQVRRLSEQVASVEKLAQPGRSPMLAGMMGDSRIIDETASPIHR